jgi:hypothetical protein
MHTSSHAYHRPRWSQEHKGLSCWSFRHVVAMLRTPGTRRRPLCCLLFAVPQGRRHACMRSATSRQQPTLDAHTQLHKCLQHTQVPHVACNVQTRLKDHSPQRCPMTRHRDQSTSAAAVPGHRPYSAASPEHATSCFPAHSRGCQTLSCSASTCFGESEHNTHMHASQAWGQHPANAAHSYHTCTK